MVHKPTNPQTGEPFGSIGEFDAVVKQQAEGLDPIVQERQKPPAQIRAERMAERARLDALNGEMGGSAVADSVGIHEVDETQSDYVPERTRRQIARIHSRRGTEPQVRESVWADLGGGNYTQQREGTLDQERLADITEEHGYRWNPETRRREHGIDVVRGSRHIFVPTSERGGMSQAVSAARKALERGGGIVAVRKRKR